MIKLKIIVAGAKGVGKTSLIRRYCTGTFDIDTLSTIGVDFMVKTINIEGFGRKKTAPGEEINFSIWDFAGESKFRQLFPSYCSGASGALILYDITQPESFEDLKDWLKLINNASGKIVKFLIGSKADLVDSRALSKKQGKKFQKENNLDYFIETSAKTGKNIDDVFKRLGLEIVRRSLRECPNCGRMVQKEVIYCTFCSEKLEIHTE